MSASDILNTTKTKSDITLWFPMRVTYSRELIIKQYLDELGIESYVPMRYEVVANEDNICKLVPAIHNLIFVHSAQSKITELKQTKKELKPLRYMMRRQGSEGISEIITVPAKQMEDFIRVTESHNENLMYLDYGNYIASECQKVRIIGGKFTGVEGKILRIKKNKRVVVEIKGIAAVAMAYVEKELVEKVN